MKTCPYCAEEIKDAAIRCRWCLSWLVDEIPAIAEGPPRRVEAPVAGEPKEASGPPQATMMAPVPAQEPKVEQMSAPTEPVAPTPAATAQPTPAATAQTTSQDAQPPVAEAKIEFTHTGSRYLLGYAPDHFGIWDRNAPQQPLQTFPRNDEGWAAAWARYTQIETNWMDLRTGQKSS